MKIASTVLEMLAKSKSIQGQIADATGKHTDTIRRWIDNNDIMLTTAVVMAVIREASGLPDDQILEPVNQKVA
jgi:hypothetical protein